MHRAGWMAIGGLVVLAVQATGVADEGRIVDLFVSRGDCRNGSIAHRIDCLSWNIEQLKLRLDGGDGRIILLGQ
jgi:hypothetical protein